MINVKSYLWLKTVDIWQSKSNLIECNYERGAEMATEEIVQSYQVKLQFVSKYPKVMEKYRQSN